MGPRLLTFDVFGTVVDWRRGLTEAVRAAGFPLSDDAFDRLIDLQAGQQSQPTGFQTYAEITASSLQQALGMPEATARQIAQDCGNWPIFPDAQDGLRQLMKLAPCVAMTNSDRSHGEQVQTQLGFRLTDWICAEQVRAYKPAVRFWQAVRELRHHDFGPDWWHVSAYADYDLEVAWSLGLTCIFIDRPHQRHGRNHHWAPDLRQLAEQLQRGSIDYLNVA